MILETQTTFSDESTEAVQDLIQANVDSIKGFKEAAQSVDHVELARLFHSMAETRSKLATELQTHVMLNGERPVQEGTWLAALHRTWIDLRSKLNAGDPTVILIEAERGEDYIKQAYEETLKKTSGTPLNDVLQQQYATVKQGHESVRDLRDSFKNV